MEFESIPQELDPKKLPERRFQRQRKVPTHLDDYVLHSVIIDVGEPKAYEKAINSPEATFWTKAMEEEKLLY